jgi:hypothetical protein
MVIMNSFNQLKEKVLSMIDEMSNWSNSQRTLDGIMRNVYNEINGFVANFKTSILSEDIQDAPATLTKNGNSISNVALALEGHSSSAASHTDKQEIVRGFQLVLKQLVMKQNSIRQQWCDGQVQLCNFKFLIQDLKTVSMSYDNSIKQVNNVDGAASGSVSGKIMEDIKQLLQRINNELMHLDKKSIKPSVATDESQLSYGPIPFGLHGAEYTLQRAMNCDNKDKDREIHTSANKRSIISSSNCFVFVGDSSPKSLRVKLHEVSSVVSLKVGGCKYVSTKIIHGVSPDGKLDASPVNMLIDKEIPILQQIKLPCGIGLLDCNGDIDSTASAIGDILDWSILLKKNPPDKFLRRPPVRFLFDLFKHITEQYPNCLPQQIATADWSTIGLSKESKTEFMDEVSVPLLMKISDLIILNFLRFFQDGSFCRT